jgi:C-terminal processing protease CtpA/Prc
MKTLTNNKIIFVLALFAMLVLATNKIKATERDYTNCIYDPEIDLTTNYAENIDFVKTLQSYSVDLFGGKLTENQVDSIIQTIKGELNTIPSQKIKLTDLMHLYWTKLLYKAADADAHFRISIPNYFPIEGVEVKPENINVLPFTLRTINNRSAVGLSYDNQFKRGDVIISINDIPIEKYIEYYPSPRTYMKGRELQTFYHFSYEKTYNIKIGRNGKVSTIFSQGKPMSKRYYEEEKPKAIVYKKQNAGYFNIITFEEGADKRAEEMSLFIDSLQKEGISNLIIDVRPNQGGDSKYISNFFSIMSDKERFLTFKKSVVNFSVPLINLLKQYAPEYISKLEVAKNEGKIVDVTKLLEDKEDSGFLDNAKFKKGMKYYILMGEDTGSAAACFARLAQTNNIATLVGEPTLPNPDNNGNCFQVSWNNSPYFEVSMSSSHFEFAGEDKTVDGRIVPDIEIRDVMKPSKNDVDMQLTALLKIIKNKK